LEIYRQLKTEKGMDDPDVVYHANNIGIWNLRLKDYKGATKVFSDVLKILQRLHGVASAQALTVANNLANGYNQSGNRKASISLLRSFLGFSRQARDKVRYNLACYECLDGNYSEALRLILEHLQAHPDQKDLALQDHDLAEIRDQIRDNI